MNVFDMLLGSAKPEYVTELETEQYMHENDAWIRSNSVIDVGGMSESLRKLFDENNAAYLACVDSHTCLENQLHRLGEENTAADKKSSDSIDLMSNPFTEGFHNVLAKFMKQHPETTSQIMHLSQQVFSDDILQIQNNLVTYLKVLNYLNNSFASHVDGVDGEIFGAHLRVGQRLAAELINDILKYKNRRFLRGSEHNAIVSDWNYIMIPVNNMLGLVHQKINLRKSHMPGDSLELSPL